MTEYRYLFADLLTNQILTELPLVSVTFGQELNTSGSFQGHLLLSDIRESGYGVLDNTNPGRTAVYVVRDSTIVWAGVLWSRTYDAQAQRVTFGGREFESYFERRRINFDYNVAAASQDQLLVVQNLFNTIQGAPGSSTNIGLVVGTETSGVNVSKTYRGYEYKPLTEAVYELSKAVNGFDFNIDVSFDSNNAIQKRLRLEYPRRGVVYNASNASAPVLEFPGNIISYTYPEDGFQVSNTIYGLGAGQGEGKLVSTQTSASQLAAGWATLEGSISYTDYTDATVLASLTNAELSAKQQPIVVMTCTLATYVDPILGSYGTGDDFRIRITDDFFPSGLDVIRRLAKIEVQVGDNGPERVTLSFVVTTN